MKKLSGCEREVLSVIMDMQQAIGLREIQEEVNRRFKRTWKPQTASTIIRRMAEKGYLTPEGRGRGTLYKSTIPPEEYRKQELQNVVVLFYSGDVQQAREDLESCVDAAGGKKNE